jgi:hypothetical protein
MQTFRNEPTLAPTKNTRTKKNAIMGATPRA